MERTAIVLYIGSTMSSIGLSETLPIKVTCRPDTVYGTAFRVTTSIAETTVVPGKSVILTVPPGGGAIILQQFRSVVHADS